MKHVLILSATATLVCLGSAQADTTAAGLDGSFASIACEVRPQPNQDGTIGEWWLTRLVTIEAGTISAEFTTYAGPGCDVPMQRLDFAGRVDVQGPSDVTDGAVEADLTIDAYVRMTPLAQGFADFLNGAGGCGDVAWAVGETQDIQATGCAPLGLPAGNVTVEYEILAVQGDDIYFGARPVDGSFITSPDLRPHALLVPARRMAE